MVKAKDKARPAAKFTHSVLRTPNADDGVAMPTFVKNKEAVISPAMLRCRTAGGWGFSWQYRYQGVALDRIRTGGRMKGGVVE